MREVSREDIMEIIKGIGSVNVNVEELKPDKELNLQGIDSLDMMSILFQIENMFSIRIDEESLEKKRWLTIDEIVRNTNELISEDAG